MIKRNLRPVRLDVLMDIGCGQSAQWGDDELADMLAHQLRTPLVSDLRLDPQEIMATGLLKRRPERSMTYSDLFFGEAPPLDILLAVKNFTKFADAQSEASLPPQIATAIYYCAIAVALLRHGVKITKLENAVVARGLRWVDGQLWIDRRLRQLAHDAAVKLGVS